MKRTRRRFNRKKILERDNYICQYCSRKVTIHNAHIDHIIPVSYQEINSFDNLVTSCKRCNLLLHNKMFNSFGDKKIYILKKIKIDSKIIRAFKIMNELKEILLFLLLSSDNNDFEKEIIKIFENVDLGQKETSQDDSGDLKNFYLKN